MNRKFKAILNRNESFVVDKLSKRGTQRLASSFLSHADIALEKATEVTDDRFLSASVCLDTLTDEDTKEEGAEKILADVYSQIEHSVWAVYHAMVVTIPTQMGDMEFLRSTTKDNMNDRLLGRREVKKFLKQAREQLQFHALLVSRYEVKQPNTCFFLQTEFIAEVVPVLREEIARGVRKNL